MGYYYYFYAIPNNGVEKIQNLTVKQLLEHAENPNDWPTFDELVNQEKAFDLGTDYEDTVIQIYATGTPLFTNPDTQAEYDYYDPYVVGKEGLLKAIELYEAKIINYYKNLLAGHSVQDKPKEEQWEDHIKDMLNEWLREQAINLDENKRIITSSWKYEYQIFQLVHLLKTIDWRKETLIFYGR